VKAMSTRGWSTTGDSPRVRYNIEASCALPRYTPIGRFKVLRAETCINCGRCAEQCIYDVHQRKVEDPRLMDEPHDHLCKNCFRCIQECPTRSLTKIINPVYTEIGDEYWTPEILSATWSQAETGKIPVLGAGYRGAFSGPGFDAMWTDMSEIVRPTRDGIHGREYIHTGIDIGARLDHLEFDEAGRLLTALPAIVHLPMPVLFDPINRDVHGEQVMHAVALAAYTLGTFFLFDPADWFDDLEPFWTLGVPRVKGDPEKIRSFVERAPMVEIPFTDQWSEMTDRIRAVKPDVIIAVSLPFQPDADKLTEGLMDKAVGVVHLVADDHGRAPGLPESPFLCDTVQRIHRHLVERGIRDRVTLLVSGGIAAAEHVPKAIISGADGVAIAKPLLIALECLGCRTCQLPEACPRHLRDIDPRWGASRIVNLMAAWRNQLLEVLGAMGLREVRRLRGETGRALYFEELEREVFQGGAA
jgi:ferredoxin